MLNFIWNLFSKPKQPTSLPHPAFTSEDYEIDYELKSKGLEAILGEMHGLVGHAIIPFAIGGAVDMYYFLNHIKGVQLDPKQRSRSF